MFLSKEFEMIICIHKIDNTNAIKKGKVEKNINNFKLKNHIWGMENRKQNYKKNTVEWYNPTKVDKWNN